jgi:hypothetical protein
MPAAEPPIASPGDPGLRPPSGDREHAALAAVLAVADDSGIDTSRAGIWRSGSSVMVGLPAARVLARVDEAGRAGVADRQVVVSEVLAERGVPAIGLTGPLEQPVATAAGLVTFWVWLDVTGVGVAPRALGQLARALHDATRGGADDVPAYEPLGAVRLELERAEALGLTDPADLALLRERIGRLEPRWDETQEDPLGIAVVHGDLHPHNAVATRLGPVLADLELAGVGPVCADLVPHVVAVRRYGAPPHVLDDFLSGYGLEAAGWRGFEVLVQAYELWVTASAVANRGGSARLEEEAEVRLDRWRPGRISARPWALH